MNAADINALSKDEFAKELRERMEKLRVKAPELASRAGIVTRQTITQITNKGQGAQPATRKALWEALDTFDPALAADYEEGVKVYKADPPAAADPIRVRMKGITGVEFGIEEIEFSGNPSEKDTVQQMALDFIRELREGRTPDDKPE